MRQLIRVHPDERIDLPDMEQIGGLLELFDVMRANRSVLLPEGRSVGAATLQPTDTHIFTGFDLYDVVHAAATAKLRIGSGIFKLLEDGELTHGILLGDVGADYHLLDLSAAADDTYSVFVRATYTDSDQENRVHWNVGGSPAEFVDFVKTRRSLTWESTWQSSTAAHPSGGDWVEVWRITIVSNQITTNEDYRMMFYEGDAISGSDQWEHEWGDGANDRNADRASYGVEDVHRWAQAVRRQLADIIGDASGDHKWYSEPSIELKSLNGEHYSESESASGTPGEHKQLTFGSLGGGGQRHRFSSVDQDTLSLEMLNQPDNPQLNITADDGAGTSDILWTPRGSGIPLTVGDVCQRRIGDDTNPDFLDRVIKNATNSYTRLIAFNGTTHLQMDGGSAASPIQSDFSGMVKSADGYRISTPKNTDIIQFSLQMLNNGASGARGYDKVTGANTAGRLTVASTTPMIYTSAEIALPHNAAIVAVRILWAQGSAGGGTQAGIRMYAQKHRSALTSVGQVGGGTGSPTTFVNLHLTNQYIEHTLSAGGCAAPYRRVEEFTCNASVANRTFDATQDKLVITLESVDDAGSIACSVYWIMVQYTMDYVTPPLV